HGCRKDGSSFRAEIALMPVKTDSGLLVASTVRAVDAVDESDAYFRTLLESAPDAMIIVDDDGKIAVVNGQAEAMFGYSRGELAGRPIEMLLPERLRDTHLPSREAYQSDPSLRPMGDGRELLARRKDGTEFPVEVSLSPAKTAHGTFVSSVIRDVTERKAMEQQIIEAKQEAERANKANSAFLAAASHDLRQPVQALSLLNGALRRTVSDARAIEMIDSQAHSLTAMTNLLNSLLDISRLDAGAVTPELEDFPIRRLVDRLSAEFSRQAQHKGLHFESASCDAVVRSDPNLLVEIIQNFVSNAIRYTESGSVRMSCDIDDEVCILKVTDTGVGIDENQRDEIFREFHQIRDSGGGQEGFGLGLAIVKRLAELLGHRVHVESELGKGSEFAVHVPLVGAVDDVTPGNRSSQPVDGGTESGGGALIVLIEDDINVAKAWGLLLEAEGYRVATARSAGEALDVSKGLDGEPDLLISDFHLIDGSTGVEAVARVREHYGKAIPAFVVSGDTSKVVKDARLLENCTLMSKPVDTGRLLLMAGAAIESGRIDAD
ncbi:MAG: PAS domain S-box protein, partial [Pseudomonadota bacterium]